MKDIAFRGECIKIFEVLRMQQKGNREVISKH